jgi:hypothetical protein
VTGGGRPALRRGQDTRADLCDHVPGALLLAIAALGAGTTVTELRYIGWRPAAVFFAATGVFLAAVALGLWVIAQR